MAGEGHLDDEDPVLLDAGVAFNEYMAYLADKIEERRQRYRSGTGCRRRHQHPGRRLGGRRPRVQRGAAAGRAHDVPDGAAGRRQRDHPQRHVGGHAAFSRFPDQWQHLLDHPESFASMADEVVRFVSPVISFARTATQDGELGGQHIAEGEKILIMYQSANRAPTSSDDPDAFRVDRGPNPHLAFGIGPHVCVGINLARLDIRVLFEEIARRFPDMRAVPGSVPEYIPHALVHSIERLPVEYTPEPG